MAVTRSSQSRQSPPMEGARVASRQTSKSSSTAESASEAKLGKSGSSIDQLAYLDELAQAPVLVPDGNFDIGSQELDEDSEYLEGGFVRQFVGSSKSWLTSMVIHLIVILTLALMTTNSANRSRLVLEVGTDDYSSLTEMDELEFDTAEFQSFDDVDENPQTLDPALLDYQPELDMPEIQAPLELENPLGESDALKRVSRNMLAQELNAGDGGSSFFGIEVTGDSIVYIVDRSGSMTGERWESATNELLKSIQSLEPNQKFYVFLFSGKCHPMPAIEGRNTLVAATKENKERFRKWLKKQFPDDTTKPLSSVRRAINMKPDTIFLLTDGQFYDNTVEFLRRKADLDARRTPDKDLSINTIGFYCDQSLELLLQEIAFYHSGTFRSIQ